MIGDDVVSGHGEFGVAHAVKVLLAGDGPGQYAADARISAAGEDEADLRASRQRGFAEIVGEETWHFTHVSRRADHERLIRMDGGVVAAPDPVQKIKRLIVKSVGKPLGNETRIARGTEIKDQ